MAITISYQDGEWEQPSETIRKLIFDQWDESQTANVKPMMISPSGIGGAAAAKTDEDSLSSNDWIAKTKGDLIRFRVTDHTQQKPEDADNAHTRKNYIVQIDVFGSNEYLSALFREMIDSIIFENVPNSSTRIRKSDGLDSGIVTFDRQTIEWTEIGTFGDGGLEREWQGELGTLYQKNKTL